MEADVLCVLPKVLYEMQTAQNRLMAAANLGMVVLRELIAGLMVSKEEGLLASPKCCLQSLQHPHS